jgi:hypothetical protein
MYNPENYKGLTFAGRIRILAGEISKNRLDHSHEMTAKPNTTLV